MPLDPYDFPYPSSISIPFSRMFPGFHAFDFEVQDFLWLLPIGILDLFLDGCLPSCFYIFRTGHAWRCRTEQIPLGSRSPPIWAIWIFAGAVSIRAFLIPAGTCDFSMHFPLEFGFRLHHL